MVLREKIQNRLPVDSRERNPQACRQRRSEIDQRHFTFECLGRQICTPREDEALRAVIPRAGVEGLHSNLTNAW